ncbi:MAG: hydrogenase iron-sulfur subunit, partial [Delftia sp.]|nr:hydrogenase iron-sulfur subunit [Delftia sp.]
ADVALLESYPDDVARTASVRIIHIPCSGRIDPSMALRALRSGIDGVLVCGCQPGECHYQRGAQVSACKLGLLGRVMDQMQVPGRERVRLVQIGTQERGRIRREVDAMLEHLAAYADVRPADVRPTEAQS